MKSMTKLAALGVVAALALVGCGSASNLEGKSDNSGGSSDILVVGSQEYYSNEILAEIYAQSLEKAGHKVDRQLNIGQPTPPPVRRSRSAQSSQVPCQRGSRPSIRLPQPTRTPTW